MTHTKECRWENTKPSECAFRETHHFCSHPEHACDCAALKGQPFVFAPEEPEKPKVFTIYNLECDVCKKVCGTLTLPEGKQPVDTFEIYCDDHVKK